MMGINKKIFFFILGITLSFYPRAALANNLVVNNFDVYQINESTNTITFACDVAWENSWKTTSNRDAIWIFMKYSTDAGVTWSHASMSSSGVNPNGFYAPSNFQIVVPADEKGLFLERSDLSTGNVSAQGVRFVWDYNQDGLTDAQAMAANTVNKVFGVEMVYIPQGAFYAGDDTSSSNYNFKQGGSDDDPWYVQSEAAINVTNTTADGYYYQSSGSSGENSSGSVFLIPSSYPKGYNDFYVMKYELTEGQWASFFNTLSVNQRTTRDITSSNQGGKASDAVVDRNTLSWDSTNPMSRMTTARPERPVTYVSWPDVLAYADWAGLRPITELEYEKVARGSDITPVSNEFAWGTAASNDALAAEIYPDSDEDGEEQIFDGGANLNRNNLSWSTGDGRAAGTAVGQKGPLRAGIFAESSTNRTTSGAGYYGVLELSGNLSEAVVTLGRSQGRQFLGTHGDGQLSSVSSYEGNATNSDWPGINTTDSARGVTGTVGSGLRGGDFGSTSIRHFQISDRSFAAKDPDTLGYNQRYDASFGIYLGGRLGRTAP